jgi:hypothetical protein
MISGVSLEFKRPHRAVDSDLAVRDADEACVSPAGIPAVLADPAPLDIIVANTADAMATLQRAADVMVDASLAVEEIRVNTEARNERPPGGEPHFHVRRAGDLMPLRDFGQPRLPVRALMAGSIARRVWERPESLPP